MRIQSNVMCPARDKVLLATDLYLPDGTEQWPAILMRTPYGKGTALEGPLYDHYDAFVAAGYIVAVQDCRGTGASQGRMDLNARNEHEDGFDAVEWLAGLPCCDGRIGMFGLSYFGFTQLAAASERPEHLLAICPFMTLSQQPFGADRMQTLNLGHLGWAYGQLLEHATEYMPDPAFREKMLPILKDYAPHLMELAMAQPMDQHPAACLPGVPLLDDYLELVRGVEDKAFWDELRCPLPYDNMHVASFHATGWLDIACDATIDNYHAARASSDAFTRAHAQLLIGPWTHGGEMSDVVEDVSFGENASGETQDVSGMMLRWFDHTIRGNPGSCFDSRVLYFIGGSNQWRSATEWPPPEAVLRRLYLSANELLIDHAPDESVCAFQADPKHPTPSAMKDRAGRCILPDWSELDARADVLAFRTQPLEAPVTMAGFAQLDVALTTDVPDTDIACRLLDVSPDGLARQIAAGITRARHRRGLFHTDFLTQGQEEQLRVFIGNGAHCFQRGHRIAIQVMGALYPAHDRNLNTRAIPSLSTEQQIAQNRIRLGGAQASYLSLLVLE